MEQNVDVERLNRHLSELAWAPTVEISRSELLAVLSRLEQAEQAREQAVVDYEAAEIKVHRVRELHGLIAVFVNRDTTPTAYCAHCYDQQVDDAEYPCPTIRALDGDARRCIECNGTGDVQVLFNHGIQTQDCAVCFGTGDGRG